MNSGHDSNEALDLLFTDIKENLGIAIINDLTGPTA